MSVASTIPGIKISPSSSSSSPASFSFSARISILRCSKAEGPLRRPVAPSLREPAPPIKPAPPLSPSTAAPEAPPKPVLRTGVAGTSSKDVVTLEFQRKMAKEMQDYFKKKKLEEDVQGPFFGFLGKNEISNGRWAMFGFAVGLLTEYATGSDFVDQLKILLSNFGIVDLE